MPFVQDRSLTESRSEGTRGLVKHEL